MKKNKSSRPEASGDGVRIRPVRFEPRQAARPASAISIDRRTILILALIFICGFFAWFLFAARAVYIETEPAEADLDIDALLQFSLGNRLLLLPGEYELLLASDGYHPLRRELRIGQAQDQHFTYELERLPGHLSVDTGSVEGADVLVDGAPKGKAPLTIRGIPHGDHRVQVTADRYFPHQENVPIEGLDKEQTLKVDLVPAWAEVTLKSTPAGAEVLVDDQPVGVTPLTTEILEGEHSVRVRSPGYQEWQKDLRIVAGQPVTVDDIRLQLADAIVYLTSEPAAASTTVDGQYRGLTPLELALAPGKSATIRLFKQGYERAEGTITAQSGDRQRVSIRLQPELAAVEVRVDPADAKIYVDGALQGTGGQTLKLPTRRHRIEARREGYADYETAVTPHPEFVQKVEIRMKTREQARREAIKPSIETRQGYTLKLFYPGKFTMGASRREPGRRANETLQNVNLTRPFYLGLREVTNGEFKEFRSGHSSGRVQGNTLEGEQHPVVSVTWEQAALYCNWLSERESLPPFYRAQGEKVVGLNPSSTGYRLPTEAEWEWAARVTDGRAMLKFPWGDEMPPARKSGNFADESASTIIGKVLYKYDDGFVATAPVKSFPANAKGLFDMGGNAAEWVHDFYSVAAGDTDSYLVDPLGPERGEFHVIRGSSWAHGTISELRLSYRDYGNKAREDVGFRIARFLD